MPKNIVIIHVGAIHTIFGLFTEGELKHTWRIETRPARSPDEYIAWLERVLRQEGFTGADIALSLISCVHPETLRCVRRAAEAFTGNVPLVMKAGLKTGVQVQMGRHEDFDADRIANMVAAAERGHMPALIVDLGAVTRIDVLGPQKKHLGSLVMLGVQKSLEGLSHMSHAYPDAAIEKPERIIGKYASDAVQSGAYYGTLSMLEGLTERILYEMNTIEKVQERPYIIATGGYAKALSTHTDLFDEVIPSLTLEGLYRIALKNMKSAS